MQKGSSEKKSYCGCLLVSFAPVRRRSGAGGRDGPGELSSTTNGLSHSSSNCRPTDGSSSVPSRDTLTSRPWFHGFRTCRVRKNGSRSVRIHSTRKGRSHVDPLPSLDTSEIGFGLSSTLSLETSCSASCPADSRVHLVGKFPREGSELRLDDDAGMGSNVCRGAVLVRVFGMEYASLSYGFSANANVGRPAGAE